ncbi:MAG: hypothetical protein Q7O66_09525 [Dehalococcoidia bacterium]|nr:hypothetical protein [Dehalococcoidia bacterium]
MTDTQTQPMSEAELAEIAIYVGYGTASVLTQKRLTAEIRRLQASNKKLVGLLKETDAWANNIHLDISQLFREIGVNDD